MSGVGELIEGVRSSSLYRQLIPLEARAGWPLPHRRRRPGDGRLMPYVCLPFLMVRALPGQPAELFPPFAALTLEWPTGRPVEYLDLHYTRPWPVDVPPRPVGLFPHDAVRGTVRDYETARAALFDGFDRLLRCYVEDRAFEGPEAAEFGALLRRLVEPGLAPYYRVLAPEFCAEFLGGDAAAQSSVE